MAAPMAPMWGVQTLVANPAQGGWQVIQLPMNGNAGQMQAAPVDPQEMQQLRAEYQWQAQKQEQEMATLQTHLETLERQRVEMKERWEREKKALTAEISRYQTVLMTYAIPLDEAKSLQEDCNAELDQMQRMQTSVLEQEHHEQESEQAMMQQHIMQQLQMQPSWDSAQFNQDLSFGGACGGGDESTSLNEKLRRLNGLLSEDTNRGSQGEKADGDGSGTDPAGAKSIASTLQAMFPNATVRTDTNKNPGADILQKLQYGEQKNGGSKYGGNSDRETGSMADPMVRKMATGLEQETGSEIDDRAMMSLRNLSVRLALEALQKVDDLVQSQGGQCRNLSSILQSVCRKMERWTKEDPVPDRRFESRLGHTQVHHAALPEGRANGDYRGGRGNPGREEEPEKKEEDDDSQEHWTQKRVERAAESGFELRQEGEQWRLKINLAGLDPPLPESGMGRFCAWLKKKLAAFRTEHGSKALRYCQGDLDFSSNGLSDDSLWMLLESLTQFEVQAAVLKLTKNCISAAGALALGEFIRNCKGAGPVYELHLSENEIDDDAALDLFRTVKDLQPRYPARRQDSQGSHSVPMLIRLDKNRIDDPAAVLNTLTAEGCSHTLDATQCYRSMKKCPLLHLQQFQDQASLLKKPVAAIANGNVAEEKAANGSEGAGKKKKSTNKCKDVVEEQEGKVAAA